MKTIITITAFLAIHFGLSSQTQFESQYMELDSTFVSIRMSGDKEKVGYLVEQNQDYLVLWTDLLGRIRIPKYEIERIEEVNEETYVADKDQAPHYSGRYHLLFNGLPQKKGSSTLGLTVASADYQYSSTEYTTVGAVGSWFALSAIASMKHSVPLKDKLYLNMGAYAGGGYVGLVALPYISATYGTERANVTLGGGFSFASYESWDGEWSATFMAAATIPMGDRVQWVTEGVWVLPKSQSYSYSWQDSNGDQVGYTEEFSTYGMGYLISAIRIPLGKSNQLQVGLQLGIDQWSYTDTYYGGEYAGEYYSASYTDYMPLPLVSYSKSW